MFINSKEELINYFHKGAKKDLFIGVENEKFLFDHSTNLRVSYSKVKEVLSYLKKFGWQEITEGENLIGLKNNGKNISLEPGNQIELSGAKLKNIHEVCSESFVFLDEMKKTCKELNLKMISLGFDPISKIENVPKNPKMRYEIMTVEMPKHGKSSLEMMYQTCGTQVNIDYNSEIDSNKIRSSTGVAVDWLTPVGPLTFSLSQPITKASSDQTESFRFDIGTTF